MFIPYPYATDDHQTANGRAFEAAGGGWLVPQNKFTPDALADALSLLATQPELLRTAAQASAAFAVPDAANRLANVVTGLIQGEDGSRMKAGAAAASISTQSMKRGAA